MSTNTSEQHQGAARQPAVEAVPYELWSQPRTAAVAQVMRIEGFEDLGAVPGTFSSLGQTVSPLN
jgi:hypothetical protein